MGNQIANLKQQQQIMNMFVMPAINQALKNKTTPINYPATITKTYDDNNHADVSLDFGSSPSIFTNVPNKSGVILYLNDTVEIEAPHGDLSTCYIKTSYRNIPSISAENITGILKMGNNTNQNGSIIFYDASTNHEAIQLQNYFISFYDYLQTQMQIGGIGSFRGNDASGNPTGAPSLQLVAEKGCAVSLTTRNTDGKTTQNRFVISNNAYNDGIQAYMYNKFSVNDVFSVTADTHHGIYINNDTIGDNQVYGNTNCEGWNWHDIGTLTCTNLTVSPGGTKNCVQETKNFGDRLFYSYELGENLLGDYGFGKTNDNECVVFIDPIIVESINTETSYLIKLFPYKNVKYEIIEQTPRYFVVHTDEDFEFGWEITGHRRGFEHLRLEHEDNLRKKLIPPQEHNLLLDQLHDDSIDMLNKSLFKNMIDNDEALQVKNN